MAEATEQIVREAPEIEAYKIGLLKSAQALQPPVLPVYQVAGMSGAQESAINRGLAGIGAYQPYMSQALQGMTGAQQLASGASANFDPNQLAQFINPYQQLVMDRALENINRQGQLSQQNLQAQAVRAGAFGGSREGVQRAELARGLAETKNTAITNLLNQGYQQAMQAYDTQRARQLQGAQLGGQLAQGIGALGAQNQMLGQQDVTFAYGLGQQQQAQQQRELDALRASQLQAAYQPYQQLGFLSDIYKGAPSTQMAVTTQSAPAPSPFQQVAGLATGALATFGAINTAGKAAGGLF